MKAHELLSDESKWTRGEYARDKNGRPIDPTFDGALCFCTMGAIVAVHGSFSAALDDLETVARFVTEAPPEAHVDGDDTAPWNDAPERTFQEVHDLLVKLDI